MSDEIFFIGFVFMFLAILAVVLLTIIFWIFMIIDAAKRKFKTDNEQIVWILILVLTGLIGALIYYFVVKYPEKKK